jgi:hypothetical protein
VKLEKTNVSGENRVPGQVERSVYLGNAVQLIVKLATGNVIQVLMQNGGEEIPFNPGDSVQAHLPRDALRVLTDTGAKLPSADPGAVK